jgi:hypothetical protein
MMRAKCRYFNVQAGGTYGYHCVLKIKPIEISAAGIILHTFIQDSLTLTLY